MASGMASTVVHLTLDGKPLELKMSVPVGPVSARSMLPMFRSLADAFANLDQEHARVRGLTVSCKKGCTACCRHLVPMTEIETIELRQMVQKMPEPRRAEVLRRFAKTREQSESAGLIEELRHTGQMTEPELISLAMRYFSQWIPCPFLEQELCSIYSERPLACRKHQVVSPAEFCSRPQDAKVQPTETLADVSQAVRSFQADKATPAYSWIPLILALEWAEAHPNEGPTRPGTEWADELLANLRQQAAKAREKGHATH